MVRAGDCALKADRPSSSKWPAQEPSCSELAAAAPLSPCKALYRPLVRYNWEAKGGVDGEARGARAATSKIGARTFVSSTPFFAAPLPSPLPTSINRLHEGLLAMVNTLKMSRCASLYLASSVSHADDPLVRFRRKPVRQLSPASSSSSSSAEGTSGSWGKTGAALTSGELMNAQLDDEEEDSEEEDGSGEEEEDSEEDDFAPERAAVQQYVGESDLEDALAFSSDEEEDDGGRNAKGKRVAGAWQRSLQRRSLDLD